MLANLFLLWSFFLGFTCLETSRSSLPSYYSRSTHDRSRYESQEYLISSVVRGDVKEVLRIVQSNTTLTNARHGDTTALMQAIVQEDIRMIRLLLNYGANPNDYVEGPTAGPPSFWAIEANNTEILKLLLEYCAEPNVQRAHLLESGEVENRTLLEAAQMMQNHKMVELVDEYLMHGCGRCPAEKKTFSHLNINWWLPETASRNVANISCPAGYGFNFGTWRCGSNSTWDEAPDLSPCRKVNNMLIHEGDEDTTNATAAENLSNLANNINSVSLLPGDILAIDDALKSLQKQHINHDLLQYEPEAPALTKKYLTALVNVTGKMLDEPPMWEAMPKVAAQTVFTDLQENVVQGALTTAQYQMDNATDDYPNNNLHVRVAHQPAGYFTADQNRLYKHLVFPKTHLQLPERFYHKYSPSRMNTDEASLDHEGLKELITVIFSSYRDLHCISNSIPCTPPQDNYTTVKAQGQVNSGVIGAKVGYGHAWEAEDNDVVEVTFKHIYDGIIYQLENPECVWWNTENNTWSSQGCYLYDFTASYTTCHCTHLTNLAVIMDINGLIDQETILYQTLQWITVIGCSLSIVSLAVCIVCFLFLKKVKTKRSSTIRANLCICLLVAEVVLLLGLNATKRELICKGVAISLHYLFLAAFTWSAIEAFNLYLVLVKVFETPTSLKKCYMLVGYGTPLVFVGITLGITKAEGYGTEKMCWLAPDNPIWIFAGSLALIITMNLISFVLTMRVAWRERPVVKVKIPSDSSSQLTKRLSGSTAIFLMLGLTWVTGFFYMAEGTEMLALMFTVLNSLQGFGIFVFGILLDDTIRKEAKEVIGHQMDARKVSASFTGSIIPQRRGSYNFTESEEITRDESGGKLALPVNTDESPAGHFESLQTKTKL